MDSYKDGWMEGWMAGRDNFFLGTLRFSVDCIPELNEGKRQTPIRSEQGITIV